MVGQSHCTCHVIVRQCHEMHYMFLLVILFKLQKVGIFRLQLFEGLWWQSVERQCTSVYFNLRLSKDNICFFCSVPKRKVTTTLCIDCTESRRQLIPIMEIFLCFYFQWYYYQNQILLLIWLKTESANTKDCRDQISAQLVLWLHWH